MKALKPMALILLSLLTCVSFAAEKKAAKTESKSQLSRSFRFDGSSLRGKYQSSLGTSATVENDKYMDDLLGGRKKFDDRIREEKQRN
jgi:hypothetical protein